MIKLKFKIIGFFLVALFAALAVFRFIIPMREKSTYYRLRQVVASPCLEYIFELKSMPSGLSSVVDRGFLSAEDVSYDPSRDVYMLAKMKYVEFRFRIEGSTIIIDPSDQFWGLVRPEKIVVDVKSLDAPYIRTSQ